MKKVLRIIGFTFIVAIAFAITYNVYKIKDTNAQSESAILQIGEIDEDLIDVFFVGSSHVYCGVQPGTIFESAGISSFDLSISGMDLESAYYFTKYETAIHNPKVVFVDIYGLTFNGYSDAPSLIGNKYRNLLQLPYSKEAYDLLKNTVDDEEFLDYLIRWPIIHTRYKELTDVDFRNTDKFEFTKGELLQTEISYYLDLSSVNSTNSVRPLSDAHKEWTERFVELSKERGFELVFLVLPYQRGEKDQSIFNGFKEYVKEKGYTYVDMLEHIDELNLSREDFSDPGHLNIYGGKKVSKWLTSYLMEQYDLEDHREDALYESWEKDAQYTTMVEKVIELKNCSEIASPYTFLSDIQRYDSIVNIVVLRGTLDDCYEPIEEYIDCLGLEFADYIDGGVWIIKKDGTKKLASLEEDNIVFFDIDSKNSLRISTKEDDGFIKLNAESIPTIANGLTVITYDMFEQQIILNKQYN